MTKGNMIKDLKAVGIRHAVKAETNEFIKIEHLKEHQVIELWTENCKYGFERQSHDAEYYREYINNVGV